MNTCWPCLIPLDNGRQLLGECYLELLYFSVCGILLQPGLVRFLSSVCVTSGLCVCCLACYLAFPPLCVSLDFGLRAVLCVGVNLTPFGCVCSLILNLVCPKNLE